MEQFNGIYIGKIVDNRDPEEFGRVKVFCSNPNISNYYANLITSRHIEYKFPGNEGFDAEFIRTIKAFLPWARMIQPIMGGSAPGKFDAANNRATRSNNPENSANSPNTTFNSDGYDITPMEALRLAGVTDAFAFPEVAMVPKGNPYGATDYMAPTFASKPTGVFNIPRVGSTVSVQFINGDLNKPIITGNAIENESFYEANHDGGAPIGHPGNFENI